MYLTFYDRIEGGGGGGGIKAWTHEQIMQNIWWTLRALNMKGDMNMDADWVSSTRLWAAQPWTW